MKKNDFITQCTILPDIQLLKQVKRHQFFVKLTIECILFYTDDAILTV